MRTGSRIVALRADASATLLMLADELEQLAIGASAALLGNVGRVLPGIADDRAQALQIGARMRGREARGRGVVGDQLGAPALGLMERERVARVAELALGDGRARELDVV